MEMKDAILRIIFANLGNKLESTPHYTSAREIAEMMKEFIEWLRIPDTLNTNCNNMLTNDALFSYWHTEIYKKQ